MKLYCISGLGVDRRAFENISIKGVELMHIDWIQPLKDESLKDYAKRLFEQQNLPENYNLLGLSLGGMIATEIARIRKPQKLILVSSIASRNELPLKFKIGGFLRIHKILPLRLMKKGNFITYFLFGVKTSENRALLDQILRETDINFLRWALDAIVKWKNREETDCVRIHGTNDRILNGYKIDYPIQKGGHFMIVNRAEEISSNLQAELGESNFYS